MQRLVQMHLRMQCSRNALEGHAAGTLGIPQKARDKLLHYMQGTGGRQGTGNRQGNDVDD